MERWLPSMWAAAVCLLTKLVHTHLWVDGPIDRVIMVCWVIVLLPKTVLLKRGWRGLLSHQHAAYLKEESPRPFPLLNRRTLESRAEEAFYPTAKDSREWAFPSKLADRTDFATISVALAWWLYNWDKPDGRAFNSKNDLRGNFAGALGITFTCVESGVSDKHGNYRRNNPYKHYALY